MQQNQNQDQDYMARALELAQRGRPSPNPHVGAVIVDSRTGRVIGEGWHERCGELHAERQALADCIKHGESPKGSTLYVTLEPCCHQGRQPPCTEAILQAGITRVVIGSRDPNPQVSGKGLEILREHGIQITDGVLQRECDALNPVFFHYIRTKRPYVILKYAMTLDGKIATYTGASQWITGEAARQRVHQDRGKYAAILAGVGTVLADNPLLTCRLENKNNEKNDYQNPIRIICDSALRTPLESNLVQTAGEIQTIFAVCRAEFDRIAAFKAKGCQVWKLPECAGHVDLSALMDRLGQSEIDSVLLEGGGELNWAMLESGLVQHVQAYIAPKIFGGETAKTPVRGTGIATPDQAILLKNRKISQIGIDFLLEGDVNPDVYGNC